MSSEPPRLRGSAKARKGPYPLGEFPEDVIVSIGRLLVHRLAIGHADITGDDFASIFASAIGGTHYKKPLGVTDVVLADCSWSAKTVQSRRPFSQKSVRLISGRNSPDYSYGITDPRKDLELTGKAVLNVWNQRVNQSLNDYDDLRIVVLVRNMDRLEFSLFEYESVRFTPADYLWKLNKQKNLEGFDKATEKHCFTWQPHGSQFTILKDLPGSAHRFRIAHYPGLIEPQHILDLIKFDDGWIERL